MRVFFTLFALLSTLMASDSAVIVNSGSTNTAGFRIEVNSSGEAIYIPQPRRVGPQAHESTQPIKRQLTPALVQQFLTELKSAKPLASLPYQRCMKSASFGTTLVVEYGGEKTPDLSCGNQQDSRTKALAQAANEIVSQFNTR